MYTKGEWEVELFNKDRGEKGGYFIGNGEVPIATMTSLPEVKANAHLIAAAPKMYEALKAIAAEGTRCLTQEEFRPVREVYNIDMVDRLARQAIAQVEGK